MFTSQRGDNILQFYIAKWRDEKTDNKRLKRIWYGMIRRCHGKSIPKHMALYYRDKGISVCDEWRCDYAGFEKWAKENGYSDELTIDRIDSEKNYCPENCQWITRGENSRKAVLDWRKKQITEHRSDVGHFMVVEEIKYQFRQHTIKLYKVIRTGLYKSEAGMLVKKLNSELPMWYHRYTVRATMDCKEGDVVQWEETGQYLSSKNK